MRSCIERLEARIVFDDHTGGLVTGSFPPGSPSPSGPPTLHIIPIPASTPQVSTPVLGTFGGSGKAAHFSLTTAAGTAVEMTLTGGTATIYQDNAGYRLTITASSAAVFSVTTHKGNNTVELTDIAVTGTLAKMTAKSASLTGTLAVSGAIGALALGAISGTIASGGGSISSITAASLTNAEILSGANLSGSTNTYSAGFIGSLTVTGTVTNSTIGAGLNPTTDQVTGGTASAIHSIVVKGSVDANSRFIAGGFATAKIPKPVNPATDPHFES